MGFVALATTFSGFASSGFRAAAEDLSPNHSLAIRMVNNVATTIASVALTIFVGVVTHGNQSVPQWREIFMVVGMISIISGAIYCLFGQSEVLQWNSFGVRSKPKGVELLLRHLNNNNKNAAYTHRAETDEEQPLKC